MFVSLHVVLNYDKIHNASKIYPEIEEDYIESYMFDIFPGDGCLDPDTRRQQQQEEFPRQPPGGGRRQLRDLPSLQRDGGEAEVKEGKQCRGFYEVILKEN